MILKNKGPFKKGPSIWAREDGLRTWKKIKKESLGLHVLLSFFKKKNSNLRVIRKRFF
jgi:hypothetical protein